MSQAIRISDAEMVELRRAAALNNRSIAGQAEYWIRLGRAAERHPEMTMTKIEQALRGLRPIQDGDLDDAQQIEFLTRLDEAPLTAQGRTVYRAMREAGSGVGQDEDDAFEYVPNAGP